ncbi:MAG: zinc ribbon domain-containing protein [Oscillospiraceae bacterium]
MYCINCGAKLQDDMKFCDECGVKVKTSVSEQIKAKGDLAPTRLAVSTERSEASPQNDVGVQKTVVPKMASHNDADKDRDSKGLTLARIIRIIAVVCLICFFIPMCTVSCDGELLAEPSAWQISTDSVKNADGSDISSENLDSMPWLLVVLMTTGISFFAITTYMDKNDNPLLSVIGFLCGVTGFILLSVANGKITSYCEDYGADVTFNMIFYISLIGNALIAAINVYILSKSKFAHSDKLGTDNNAWHSQ